MEIPQKLQNQLAQFQQIQQQLQVITVKRHQMTTQLSEIESAIESINQIGEKTTIYKSIGSILIKVEDVGQLSKEMMEGKETLTIKIKSLEGQESHLRERYQALQDELSKALKGMGG